MIAEPPIDVFDFWATDWLTGPASDGLVEYFDKWFGFRAGAGDPELERARLGDLDVSIWQQPAFPGGFEFSFLNRGAVRSGARLRHLSIYDGETGAETTWTLLEGLTDLDVVWRRDLIEFFPGEPGLEELKAVVARYWSNDYVPRLIQQADPATLEFFFVPREGPPAP